MPDPLKLSIIIPVLNEADCLDQNLARLFAIPGVASHCEVIICDGGSSDNSLEIAQRHCCRIAHSLPGRAVQMNFACQHARGEFLLFLHADSNLPIDFLHTIKSGVQWGFFRLRLSDDAFVYRIIESAINLRTRVSRIAGGDQGLFFKRDFFASLNGFPQISLMEDVAICKIARRRAQPDIIESAIGSSTRRWRENGIAKTVLLMWSLRLAYWLGVNPERLYKFYYPQRG